MKLWNIIYLIKLKLGLYFIKGNQIFLGEYMKLNERTIIELRKIINDDEGHYDYKSGPKLVAFFNKLGFNDSYGDDFPSRWKYTEEKLNMINDTSVMDKCIKETFSVINFIEKIEILDNLIEHFNKYLAFDKFKIIRDNEKIIIKNISNIIIEQTNNEEKLFLDRYSDDYNISILNLGNELETILNFRISEIKSCLENENPLSAIFLMGSVLEGILFGFSQSFEDIYLQEGKRLNKNIKKLDDISLNYLIEISFNEGFIKNDVDNFSHSLRKFRTYIHPNKQLKENFYPDMHTAKICWAVLQATIYQLSNVEMHSNHCPRIMYL